MDMDRRVVLNRSSSLSTLRPASAPAPGQRISAVPHRCAGPCRHRSTAIPRIKSVILKQYQERYPERLVQLALNEADVLARQTGFPDFVFPALAEEKAQGVAAWHHRQLSVLKRSRLNRHLAG